MKSFRLVLACTLFTGYITSISSCSVSLRSSTGTGNGKHKGWFKNPKNPHNPNTTNPKKPKDKGKGKGNNSTYSVEIPFRY